MTADNLLIARVIAEFKESYRVKYADREYAAKITGKRIFEASSREDYPAVGDYVEIEILDSHNAIIRSIVPRHTIIKRRYGDKTKIIATNIDIAFVVESVDRDYNLNRFERYFAIAKDGGVQSVIILNKIDMLSKEQLDEKTSELKARFPNIDIIFTSTVNKKGIDDLKKYIIKDKTYCFLGSSGVGKSTLINTLLEDNIIKTEEIGQHSGRGKHITTNRQIYFLENGGVLVDNPGMREIRMADTKEGVDLFFEEISILAEKCQYSNCTHSHEPGCEVIKAIESGNLDKERYLNYVNLKKEAEYYEMDDVEKRLKNRQFGKFKNNVVKDLKRFKHKDF